MGAAFHPFIGGFGSFLLLCAAQRGNVAVQGAAASVLLSTLMRGPSLVIPQASASTLLKHVHYFGKGWF